MKIIGSIDRITENTAYIVLSDDSGEIKIPLTCLPADADEGMAYTIEIIRNLEEEDKLASEIAALHKTIMDRG